jgi:hypothetical protein
MGRKRHERPSRLERIWQRRLRRWFTIGSAVAAALSVIDPDWPLHSRRLAQLILIWIRGSLGSSRP